MNYEPRQFIYRMDKLGKMHLVSITYWDCDNIASHIESQFLPDAEVGDRFLAVDRDSGDVLGQWLVEVPEPVKRLVTLPEWR